MATTAKTARRLIVVSNRLPFNVSAENGKLAFHKSAGGLVTGLAAYVESRKRTGNPSTEHVWVGWPGATVDPDLREELKREALVRFQSYPVFLTQEEMDQFYFGFCNRTIWPLFHYFPTYAAYEENLWQQYRRVNQVFCEALADVVGRDDLVWVHDYHLMLLPKLLKAKMPDVAVGFFLHVPFPSFEVFRLLPGAWRREILEGLLGADLIGFHTYEYAQHFLQSVLRILGHEHHTGLLLTPDRMVKVDSFPMGIDFDSFANGLEDAEIRKEAQHLTETLSRFKVILSVDRLDYSKGILNRLQGYEMFLEKCRQYHGKVVLVMVVVPSRIGVYQYDLMKRQIEALVGKINGRFGRVDWTPVAYQYRHLPFESLVALYHVSAVCLVTPLRDGMNLVAKEYVATQKDGAGVLILSEMAGAAKELGEAIIINPNNTGEIAKALEEALELPLEEQKRRNRVMQRRLRRYNVMRWADDFVNELTRMREVQDRIRSKLLSPRIRSEILERYQQARRRLFLLDYDGTLVPLARYPALARPDERTLAMLQALCADAKNTVVILSGRDRATLQDWFGHLPIGLVAEHGVWLKAVGQQWRILQRVTVGWKDWVLPILENYVDRLPGAFLEEKEHSIAWHYRSADPEQAHLLAAEMTDHLANLTAKADLQILQGSKVVEIRNAGIGKGNAAREWMATEHFDFILAIGDDGTDEDLFRALPESAASIKVGVANTHARYNVRSTLDVTELLKSVGRSLTKGQESGAG